MATIQTEGAPSSTAKPPRSRSGIVTWLIRILVALVVIVVMLVLAGLIYQAIGEASDVRAYPPPGQMVNVNGLNLHLY